MSHFLKAVALLAALPLLWACTGPGTLPEESTAPPEVELNVTTHRPHGMESVCRFSTLEEYERQLGWLAVPSYIEQTMQSHVINGNKYPFRQEDFSLMLEKGEFLVPRLPAGCTLTEARFWGDGRSGFDIKLADGAICTLTYWHYPRPISTDAWENRERATVTTLSGTGITHIHEKSAHEEAECGYYLWSEGDHTCQVNYSGKARKAFTRFITALDFETIPIVQE